MPRKTTVETPDLLAGMAEDVAGQPDQTFDLLNTISEDEGTPWIPDGDDPGPEGIQGVVREISTVPSDFAQGDCPLINIEDADGTLWSVRGYATVLRNQINKAQDAGLKLGDFMAIRYFGKKPSKNGKDYKSFKVAFRAQ